MPNHFKIRSIVMKRITTIICILTVLLSVPAYAGTISENYATGEVTVSGTVNPYESVGLQILADGMSMEDFALAGEKGSVVVYVDQTEADADGNYAFTITPRLGTGSYNLYIFTAGTNGYGHETLDYINKSEYDDFINELNSARSFEEFYELIDSKKLIFGKETLPLAESAHYREAMEGLYEYASDTPLTASDEYNGKYVYNTYVVMYAYNAGEISSIKDYIGCICIPGQLTEWINRIMENADMAKYFENKLGKCSFNNKAEFEDAVCEATILTTVRYCAGYADAKKIAEQNRDFIGEVPESNSIYRDIAGKDYTMDELRKALSVNTQTPVEKHTGGGSGGSKTTTPSVRTTVTDTGAEADKAPTKIDIAFTDTDSVSWANEAIAALYDKKLISGAGDGRFKPNDFITREEFVKIIVTAMELDLDSSESVFSDVPDGAWYKPYVNAAYKAQIISGTGDGIFGSGDNIKRQDMARILYNVTEISEQGAEREFKDADLIGDYAVDAVRTLSSAGIICGNENNEFLPNNYSTRAEAVCMIYRSLKYLK